VRCARAAGLTARLTAVALAACVATACESLSGLDLGGLFPGTGPLTEETVADGLREALRVGTRRAADALSAPGGFASDPALRIGLPASLEDAASTLRRLGLGAPIDGLVASMNSAAEKAAGEAVPVFADAIRSMTLQDAFAILNGPEDAATQYFREHTADPLRERFTPVVDGSMRSVGVYDRYRELVEGYERLPFAKPAVPDLADYVTDRTLDGLFSTLAEEEAAIREDPAARTTALLRRVFEP